MLQLTAGWFYSIDEWFSLSQESRLEQCKNSVFIKVNGGKENKGDLLKTQVSTNSSRYETLNNVFRHVFTCEIEFLLKITLLINKS